MRYQSIAISDLKPGNRLIYGTSEHYTDAYKFAIVREITLVKRKFEVVAYDGKKRKFFQFQKDTKVNRLI